MPDAAGTSRPPGTRAEAALDESDARLRLALDFAGIGIWEFDVATGRTCHALRHDVIFGAGEPIEDWGWAAFLAAVLPEDRSKVSAGFEDAVARGAAWDVRCRIRRRDGAMRWIELRSKPVLDAAGRPTRYFGTLADITEARRGEVALRAINERLAREVAERRADRERLDLALTAASMIGMFDGDLLDHKIYADVNFANIYGVDPELAARGVPSGFYFPQIHGQDRPAARAHFEHVIASGERYAHEHRIVRPDGALRWVLVRGHITRDADGRATRFSGIALDQTERRQAAARQEFLLGLADRLRAATGPQEALLAACAALGRHLGAARVGYGQMLDEETVRVNCGYADGVAPVEGVFPIAAFGEANLARARRGLTNVSEDIQAEPGNRSDDWGRIGTRAHVTVPLIRDGAYHGSLYVTFTQPRDWTPEEVALIEEVAARMWDAQERLRAEAALREAKAELETRVEAALRERAEIEAALRQSQKMEAVGQLTGGIAHDFNNLLTGIAGSLELLQTRLAQGRAAEAGRYIGAAQAAADRAASLTHRLLAFSRRQTLDAKPTEVNGLITGMIELIQRSVGPGIEVTARLAADLAPAFCDPHQLENAILNLAINGRDAMQEGGELIIATRAVALEPGAAAARDLPAGDYVSISVRDTGCGMAPEVAARAFDPFFTTKPLGQGTGLGLSMIYGFARQSEGTVWIDTKPGEGTEVTILLPRSDAAAANEEPEVPAAAASRTGAGHRVLVIDDEPAVRMLITEVLGDLGYESLEAAEGAAGLGLLAGAPHIDLLVTDIGLPGAMNGRQVAAAARRLAPGLKILFITGYAESSIAGTGTLEAGMHILAKPFSLDALAQRIEEILRA